jgi:hypothetical protein
MTLRLIRLLVALALLLPSSAFAQASFTEPGSIIPRGREYAPRRLDVVEKVARACPDLVRERHPHAYVDAVATLLKQEDDRWGRNGKRGNRNDPSDDAIFYRTDGSPFGGAVIDIVFAAGDPSRAAGTWIDQTDATIAANTTGVMVAPSGRLPACLTGAVPPPGPGPGPVDPPVVVTPQPPTVDLGPVLAKLSAIEARLIRLEATDPPTADLGLVNEYVDDMIGNGPGGDEPNHVTDLKERIDKTRADVAALFAWLRSRRALGF